MQRPMVIHRTEDPSEAHAFSMSRKALFAAVVLGLLSLAGVAFFVWVVAAH